MNATIEPSSRENLSFKKGVARRNQGDEKPSLNLQIRYPLGKEFRVPISSLTPSRNRKPQIHSTAFPCPSLPTNEVWQDQLASMVSHARLESESIAATTPFPNLFLPCLLEEKIKQAHDYAFRQRQVWKLSRDIHCLAV